MVPVVNNPGIAVVVVVNVVVTVLTDGVPAATTVLRYVDVTTAVVATPNGTVEVYVDVAVTGKILPLRSVEKVAYVVVTVVGVPVGVKVVVTVETFWSLPETLRVVVYVLTTVNVWPFAVRLGCVDPGVL